MEAVAVSRQEVMVAWPEMVSTWRGAGYTYVMRNMEFQSWKAPEKKPKQNLTINQKVEKLK